MQYLAQENSNMSVNLLKYVEEVESMDFFLVPISFKCYSTKSTVTVNNYNKMQYLTHKNGIMSVN